MGQVAHQMLSAEWGKIGVDFEPFFVLYSFLSLPMDSSEKSKSERLPVSHAPVVVEEVAAAPEEKAEPKETLPDMNPQDTEKQSYPSTNMWAEGPTTPLVKKQSNRVLYIVLLVLVVLLLSGGAFWFLNMRTADSSAGSDEVAVTPESEQVTPTPTPTPAVVLDKADWMFEVLNGTATPGLARKVADGLEALGYTVVEVGNAEDQTYTKTEILVSKEDMSKVSALLSDLNGEFGITTGMKVGELVDSSSTATVRLIVGPQTSSASDSSDSSESE